MRKSHERRRVRRLRRAKIRRRRREPPWRRFPPSTPPTGHHYPVSTIQISIQTQVEGLVSLRAHPVTRRLPHRGPLAFGLGVQVAIEVDELAFQGGSAFVLGGVLDHFFARQAAINTFTECVLQSSTRGTLARWPARIGAAAELSP